MAKEEVGIKHVISSSVVLCSLFICILALEHSYYGVKYKAAGDPSSTCVPMYHSVLLLHCSTTYQILFSGQYSILTLNTKKNIAAACT